VKGILYGNFLLNKKWFVAAGIVAVLGTAFCSFWAWLVPEDTTGVPGLLLRFMQLAVLGVLTEWLARNLEANIKCRFTDMTLAGGISKGTFVNSELLKNLITMAIGFVTCVMMQLVMCAFDKSADLLGSIRLIAGMTALFGAMEWMVLPMVINFKSAEKAGLILGLGLGFGLLMPVMILVNIFAEEAEPVINTILRLLSGEWSFLILAGISAAIYVIFRFVLLARVKKGDVC